MKQNLEVHEKPLRPARLQSKAPKDNLLLKWYFLFMAAGLTVTTFLGIYMAFRSNHDRRLIWGLLGAGIAIPLAALLLH
jgi:hypothetical protein